MGMTTNLASLDAYLGRKLDKYLEQLDAMDAFEEYLDRLHEQLHTEGVVVGNELYCFVDAELDFYESDAFDDWNQRMMGADRKARIALIEDFNAQRRHWVREVYVPQLAERIAEWESRNGDFPGMDA